MANANAHFDPKVLTFLQDTSSVNPHADSGNARALEKSGALGRLNVAMYICLRTTLWALLTLTLEGIATFYARDLLLKDEYVAAIRNNEGPLPVAQQFEITPSDYWDHVKVIFTKVTKQHKCKSLYAAAAGGRLPGVAPTPILQLRGLARLAQAGLARARRSS